MKQELKLETVSAVKAKQRVALHALEKQLQVLRLREVLVLLSFTVGAGLLRVPMQAVPSAEPITFFAVLAGLLFGCRKGFLVGVGALLISNFFVFGGHGPWTLFQALGFGVAGYIGGFLKGKTGYVKSALVMGGATLAFELIMNFSSLLVFPFGLMVFITALPFAAIHLISNLVFSLGLPKARKIVNEKGGFNERAVCLELIHNLKSARLPGRKAGKPR